VIGILGLCALASFGQEAPQPAQKLPLVKSGDMPFYPQLPRIAQIEGEVHLRITTDGLAVASVTVESGPPMLAKAAEENVKTWKFEPHKPTSFPVLFSYHLDKEMVTYSCDPDIPDDGTVVLKLPREVDITSHLRIRDCHDPNEGLDLSEPLRVFLEVCEVDGGRVPCNKMRIRLHSETITIEPKRFKQSEEAQGFVVPRELRADKNFDLTIEMGETVSTIKGIHPNYLKGNWRIGIDHVPFKEHTPAVYRLPDSIHCVGFVEMLWTEPGVVYLGQCS